MTRVSLPILLVSVLVGCTANASSAPAVSSEKPPTTAAFSVVPVRGFLPATSPDGTMIAFLLDPRDPHYKGHGDPFVLQVWLVHPDGSGLRKLGQQHQCCLGANPSLFWSPDGSSIVFSGIHEQRIDVATGQPLPMSSYTG
jgi:hypothetical protein